MSLEITKNEPVTIVGGGLAGCEAAWQLLRRGHRVRMYEMKPQKYSPAHNNEHLAELVCSNSLKSNSIDNASGLLKEEMRRLGSLIISTADETSIPAGAALAVDRGRFAAHVEARLKKQINFSLTRLEISNIPDDTLTIIATGPLTSDSLAQNIARLLGAQYLFFYDAIAPIVEAHSIDMDKVFRASRYDKGTPDYLNCPLEKNQYDAIRHELLAAQKISLKSFEEERYFEACLPIEVLASRGEKTLAFGPMKPVGLIDPKKGKKPYAVVQLRPENSAGTLFNMVGFQTKLKWSEQKRVFRLIPGLEKAEFSRMGSIHRNTYIHAPLLLLPTLQLKTNRNIFFAGQITGVEGYAESAAMGLWAGLNAALALEGKEIAPPPACTAVGALLNYLTTPVTADSFQPMNISFGLLNNLPHKKTGKKERKVIYAQRALQALDEWIRSCNLC
ncbi:MAG TPA: methylenetetrahydrofolate--tRNA-(uracil(54)-C(5))-methyltransferase (FADH(2)-oxidizing) TrmFO [Deltaproteobacteria bacterium]|nr:methylenetetrahydrofolate--tRNA-(uracil(54)-C(5))-methyltransferase (FADH(2)-oxidizing) TrmFO [Deltaproteobacteria bacterium]